MGEEAANNLLSLQDSLPPVPFAEIKAAIEEGQATGALIDGDPDTLAQVLWSAVHGTLALPVNMDRLDLQDPSKMIEPVIEALMQLVTKRS